MVRFISSIGDVWNSNSSIMTIFLSLYIYIYKYIYIYTLTILMGYMAYWINNIHRSDLDTFTLKISPYTLWQAKMASWKTAHTWKLLQDKRGCIWYQVPACHVRLANGISYLIFQIHIYLSIYRSIDLSIYLSNYLSIYPSISDVLYLMGFPYIWSWHNINISLSTSVTG